MTPDDEIWMRRALQLAEQGRGRVEPNPLVGAVIVRDGKIVGEGWHQQYGQAHAEVHALAAAGDAARGATLNVTLEPCCHHGKTPPCTDAIIRAGIARVVPALEDQFPQVAGQGAATLRQAGIAVEFGVCALAARRQNAPYLKLLATGRPYVHAKWAMSLDGKIATKTGDSKWISNETSRRRVHELRGRMDGILVGIGTALADDPLLTARPAGSRTACRVVLDSHGRLPIDSQLVRTARQVPTLIATTREAATLSAAGCEVLVLPPDDAGRPDIMKLLDELGRRRWTNLLVEGGSAVLGRFFDCDTVDEAHVFVAPKLIGAVDAKSPVAGRGVETIADSARWITDTIENLDGDVYLRCIRARPPLAA
ncbi:MAG: bifunctional diaminohydroxyphosphoribosylaminopyrimidine deaminase/5-amino-6-(5-phosphoribosylamino)uracil reductase RibD [Planctomycetes bacterium]|nr:bifunctional diaminohydroxyphosphoribosylaminopyrimidine deaminase/5-amino-6-(5-phosphoribosylamino)uracil reductase RibD [Planctomycetota bacterium]